MAKHIAITIYIPPKPGHVRVNMGVKGFRPISFPTLFAAREFIESFAVDKLTLRMGGHAPAWVRNATCGTAPVRM